MTEKAIKQLEAHAYVIAFYSYENQEKAIADIKELYGVVKKLYELDVISSKKRDQIMDRLANEVKQGLNDYRERNIA